MDFDVSGCAITLVRVDFQVSEYGITPSRVDFDACERGIMHLGVDFDDPGYVLTQSWRGDVLFCTQKRENPVPEALIHSETQNPLPE